MLCEWPRSCKPFLKAFALIPWGRVISSHQFQVEGKDISLANSARPKKSERRILQRLSHVLGSLSLPKKASQRWTHHFLGWSEDHQPQARHLWRGESERNPQPRKAELIESARNSHGKEKNQSEDENVARRGDRRRRRIKWRTFRLILFRHYRVILDSWIWGDMQKQNLRTAMPDILWIANDWLFRTSSRLSVMPSSNFPLQLPKSIRSTWMRCEKNLSFFVEGLPSHDEEGKNIFKCGPLFKCIMRLGIWDLWVTLVRVPSCRAKFTLPFDIKAARPTGPAKLLIYLSGEDSSTTLHSPRREEILMITGRQNPNLPLRIAILLSVISLCNFLLPYSLPPSLSSYLYCDHWI